MKYTSTSFILFCLLCWNSPNFMQAQGDVLFVENKGQWPAHVDFKAELSGGYAFLEKDGLTFVLDNTPDHAHVGHEEEKRKKSGRYAYQMKLIDGNENASVQGRMKQEFVHNYFLGNDKNKWKSNVAVYKEVRYEEVYDDIDLVVRSNTKLLEYDFVVKPGGDASKIRMNYEGVQSKKLVQGQLHLQTPMGTVTELSPVVFTRKNGLKKSVKCAFELNDKEEISFRILEDYDQSAELIIDPVLVFSTYTGSFTDNWGFTATYDEDGNTYAGGVAQSTGYPTTVGTFDSTFNGGYFSGFSTDIVISKFGPEGKDLLYSTYLGGSLNEIPHSIIVNSNHELVILGSTGSANYPVTNSAYDRIFNGSNFTPTSSSITYPNGSEIILSKLNTQGNILLGSTYFGGSGEDGLNTTNIFSLEYNYGDFARGDIYIDENDDIYISSCTYSNDLPTAANAFEPDHQGNLDALVARFSSNLDQLKWSTYVGGSGDDAAYSIDFDGSELVITGGTNSNDFNGLNGLISTYQGGQADGFVMKLSLDGRTSSAGTYLGTAAYDQSFFVEIDNSGDIYCYGQTLGDYPVTPGKYFVPNATQFIHKLNGSLSATDYSLTFGSAFTAQQQRFINISPTAFLIDKCENLYAIGWGGLVNTGHNFTTGFTDNMETTVDAFSRTTDGSDFYLMVLNQSATGLDYATYFGEPGDRFSGTGREHVDGGTSRFDENGFVYHAACASCGGSNGFPTTDSVWSQRSNSGNCNMAVFKYEFDRAPIRAQLEGSPESGCPPLKVDFKNVSNRPGEDFYWDFDDGTTSNLENPTHTFTDPGEFNVQFVIVDSANCIIADTAYFLVSVNNDKDTSLANFNSIIDTCNTLSVNFENLSKNAASYLWDFGDGVTSDDFEPNHVYVDPGNYEVSLIVNPGSICSDTFANALNIDAKNVQASIAVDDINCNNPTISFTSMIDSTFNVVDYQWLFGDGDSSTLPNPTHTYDSIADYQIVLSVTDDAGCTAITSETIEIPTIDFEITASSVDPCRPLNNPISFTPVGTSSSQPISLTWDLGDGTSIPGIPIITHIYSDTGRYVVSFIIENIEGCSDTATLPIFINDDVEISFNESGEQVSCDNENLLARLDIGATIDGDELSSVFWDLGDGTETISDSSTIFHTYDSEGNYDVKIIVETVLGCQDSTVLLVVIENSLIASTPPDLTLCNGDTASLSLLIEGTNDFELQWTPSTGLSNDTSTNPLVFPSASTEYIYTINSMLQSGLDCSITDTVMVRVDSSLSVMATADPVVIEPSKTSQLSANQGFENYSWTPIDFVSDPNSATPTTTELTTTTTFIIEVDNNGTCSAKDTITVIVEDRFCEFRSIFIPTAFSPNGDNLNDVFRVQSNVDFDRFELQIYSRWGDLVFESLDIANTWDGTFKGNLLSTDAFGYILEVECNGEIRNYQGNITLVR